MTEAASAAEVRSRLRVARNFLTEARRTLDAASDSRRRGDASAEELLLHRIESEAASLRVRRWREYVATLENTARLLGVEE